LKRLNKTLKNCGICNLAQYCGQECQKLDFPPSPGDFPEGSPGHKYICSIIYKRNIAVAAATEKMLKAKGIDVHGRRTQNAFYHDNPSVLESMKACHFGYIDMSATILGGGNPPLGQVFMNYRATSLNAKLLGEMARGKESYYGLEKALDAYLDKILELQPFYMYLRALVPLLYIQLGRDEEAYNFIKFWLKNTPRSQDFHISEDGLWLESNLPFVEYTMKDQDINEDIFEVLGIGSEKPYFIYITFFISLAIIKKNNFEKTKDEKQEEHFKKTLKYLKNHFTGLAKRGLDVPVSHGKSMRYELDRDVIGTVPASYGLKRGKYPTTGPVEKWAGDFLDNFFGDLDTYLDRKKGLRKEMIKYL